MIKNFFYFCIFIFLCMLIPVIFYKDVKIPDNYNINENKEEEKIESKKIKLLLTKEDCVIELDLEEYIMGVIIRRNAC